MSSPDAVRVYLAVTLAELDRMASLGRIEGPFNAHAITEAVRTEWADSSQEEWEYAALCLAADDCHELWRADDVGRRVVLALDAASVEPVGADDPTLVLVAEGVDWTRVVAVHADLEEADAVTGEDLRWFGTQGGRPAPRDLRFGALPG